MRVDKLPPPEHELLRDISPGTISASERDLERDPETMLILFAELMRANPDFGLHILSQARAAQLAGLSAEEASIAGAMFPLAVIARHFKSKEIWKLLSEPGSADPQPRPTKTRPVSPYKRPRHHGNGKILDKPAA